MLKAVVVVVVAAAATVPDSIAVDGPPIVNPTRGCRFVGAAIAEKELTNAEGAVECTVTIHKAAATRRFLLIIIVGN